MTIENDELSIQTYQLPPDEGWEELSNVPPELLRAAEIYAGALQDGVDSPTPTFETIDEFYETYDAMSGQKNLVAKRGAAVVGVASYDFGRNVPFFDGVAVDSEERGSGVGAALLGKVLNEASEQGIPELHSRSQPSSTERNLAILQRSGVQFTVDSSGKYPLITVFPPKTDKS